MTRPGGLHPHVRKGRAAAMTMAATVPRLRVPASGAVRRPRGGWRRALAALAWLAALALPAAWTGPASAIEIYTSHGGPVRGLDQSPDGRHMASGSFDYSAVVWSLPDYREVATLTGHNAALNVVRFSPDGEWLATGGDDSLVLLWSMAEIRSGGGAPAPVAIEAHQGKVVGLGFSRDSRLLVSSSWDGTARVWDVDRAVSGPVPGDALVMTLSGHEGPVNASAFSADGRFLYTAGHDGHIHYWRLRDGTRLRTVIRNGWGINVMHVDEDRGFIAYGTTDGAMVVHGIAADREVLRMGDDRVPVLSVAARPDGSQLGFGNAGGRVDIVDVGDMSLLRTFKAANGPVWTLLLTGERGELLLGSLDDHITKWETDQFPPHILEVPGPERRFRPTGEMGNGERQFARKCSVCHTLHPDGKRRAGPTLYGVFGRRAGTLAGYPYSEALLESDIVWTAETIGRLFSEGPDLVVPGTKMPIQRMKNERDRKDLIVYLQENTKPR